MFKLTTRAYRLVYSHDNNIKYYTINVIYLIYCNII